MTLVLYGHPESGHSLKVAVALELANIPYQAVRVDIWADPSTRPAEFLAGSPFAEVPLLLIDEHPYVQSGAILLEIATRYKVLGGETPEGLRRGRELLMWEANRIGMCLPQLRYAALTHNEGYPDGALEWLRNRYATDSANFDRLLADEPFFHGASPGIGDCAIWGYVQFFDDASVEPTPAMQAWINRMTALDAIKAPDVFFPNDG
jgi:glutathione S-transferase